MTKFQEFKTGAFTKLVKIGFFKEEIYNAIIDDAINYGGEQDRICLDMYEAMLKGEFGIAEEKFNLLDIEFSNLLNELLSTAKSVELTDRTFKVLGENNLVLLEFQRPGAVA